MCWEDREFFEFDMLRSLTSRQNLCPHGISVLGKTDFYSVGLKRNAFLVAARDVAVYEEYRPILVSHVIGVTLRHWDPVMRQLGAQSLREICRHDMASLAPNVVSRVVRHLESWTPDTYSS